MIVEAEPARRQVTRFARRWRHRQHASRRAEPEVADPAAAEARLPGSFGHITGIGRVELRTDPHRVGGDDVAASGPGAQQRGRVPVGPQQPQHVSRAQLPVQRAAHHPGRSLTAPRRLRDYAGPPSHAPRPVQDKRLSTERTVVKPARTLVTARNSRPTSRTPHRPPPGFDAGGKKVAVATGSVVILPGRPATVTTELTLPQLDGNEDDEERPIPAPRDDRRTGP